MPQQTPQLRTAEFRDGPALCATLARAFYTDPVMSWFFPDARRRESALAAFFSVLYRHAYVDHKASEMIVAGDRILAAALWNPPGQWQMDNEAMRATGEELVPILADQMARAVEYLLLADEAHPKQPHWYLGVIGTEPTVQGTGVGSALLRSRLGACDAHRLPAYLESSNPRNIPFYQRHGFRVTGEIKPEGGPSSWSMWRDPA